MTWKEILELVATVLTILVSLAALYGMIAAHRSGFFRMLRRVVSYHHGRLGEDSPPPRP